MRRKKLENLLRTDKQTDKQTENSITEPLLSPVDHRGERANRGTCFVIKFDENKDTDKQTNRQRIQLQGPLLSPVDRRGERANGA